jgi:hypothetical protein
VARKVGNENAVLPRELGRDPAPILDRPSQPVHKDDRRAVARNRITKPRAAHEELALIKFVKTVFALRHH